MSVYPKYVDYYAVLTYLTNEINKQPLDSKDIEGILEREFGVNSETPEDVKKYVFLDLKERFRTKLEGDLIVFYRYLSQLEEYQTRRALSNLFR